MAQEKLKSNAEKSVSPVKKRKRANGDSLFLNKEYSKKYRILKTLLVICSWISLSFNVEMIGPSLEDLKILLSTNYQQIAFSVIIKNIGYLSMIMISGYLLERFSNYTETLMGIANLFIVIRKLKVFFFIDRFLSIL